MATRTILLTSLRILAVCFFLRSAYCRRCPFPESTRHAQQTVASQPAPPANQQVPQMPEDFFAAF